jgi:hypothetical protein
MSKSNNPLTNYFKRKEIVDDVEEADKRTNESNGNRDVPDNNKRLKLDEFANSAISITNNSNTDSATTTSITTESSISISSSSTSNERDPAYGPAKAKDFLLIGPFQPTTKFPIVNNRRFRAEWYSMYEWLEYSLKLDRAFCFPCRLRNDSRYETAFILDGFCQWKNGTMRFNSHQAADFHKIAFERWKTAVHNLNNNTDVLKSLDQQHSKQASENRMYLKEIIRTVHFLARQGISFVVIEKTRNQVTKATS